MIGGKYCKNCKKRLVEASIGVWKIAFCKCEAVIAHITNKAICKLDIKDGVLKGEDYPELRKVLESHRRVFMSFRLALDLQAKQFPPSKVKNDRNETMFYDIKSLEEEDEDGKEQKREEVEEARANKEVKEGRKKEEESQSSKTEEGSSEDVKRDG